MTIIDIIHIDIAIGIIYIVITILTVIGMLVALVMPSAAWNVVTAIWVGMTACYVLRLI